MKKILFASLLMFLSTQSANAASLLAGFYDRANQSVEIEVAYCIDDDRLPRIDFLEGLCQATFPASCDVIVDIRNENHFPRPGEVCGSEWLSYDVADLPKPVILNFLLSDGSVGTVLVD